jgi:hypothetical protein
MGRDLRVVVLHTQSSGTLYSGVVQVWTSWCGASFPPTRGQLHRQRLVGELSERLSTMNPSLDVKAAGVQLYDSHHS